MTCTGSCPQPRKRLHMTCIYMHSFSDSCTLSSFRFLLVVAVLPFLGILAVFKCTGCMAPFSRSSDLGKHKKSCPRFNAGDGRAYGSIPDGDWAEEGPDDGDGDVDEGGGGKACPLSELGRGG